MDAQVTSIKVPSLAGGVSRTSPTKRRPDQVEEADNVFLTLERSAEKRQGTDFVNAGGTAGSINLTNPDNKDVCFFDFVTQKNKSVIIALVDVQSTDSNYQPVNMVQGFDGTTGQSVSTSILDASLATGTFVSYIQQGATVPLKERIKQVRIQDFMCFLNTEVTATYKNTDEGAVLDYVSPQLLIGSDEKTVQHPDRTDANTYTAKIGNTTFTFSSLDYGATDNAGDNKSNRSTLCTSADGLGIEVGEVSLTNYINENKQIKKVFPLNWGHQDTQINVSKGTFLGLLRYVNLNHPDEIDRNIGGTNARRAILSNNNPYGAEIRFTNSSASSGVFDGFYNNDDGKGTISFADSLGYPISATADTGDADAGVSVGDNDTLNFKLNNRYFPAGLIIPYSVISTFTERVANLNTGSMFTSQDSIAIPDFLALGSSPDSGRDYDTISRGAISSFQGTFSMIRTPFVRNTDPIRLALSKLHNEPSIVPDVRWRFPIAANLADGTTAINTTFRYVKDTTPISEAEDQRVREHRFGVHTLCGNPAEGDGFVFYVEESVAGFPAGYYRVISSPIELEDFKTTDFLVDTKDEVSYFDSTGAQVAEASAYTSESNALEVRKDLFPQPIMRLVAAARKNDNGTDNSPFSGIICDNFPGTPPYYQRIRTPEIGSVFNRATMPHIISFNGNPASPDFVVSEGPWSPRLSGDFTSNPGPSFISGTNTPLSTTSPTGQKITSIGYWRNRLWLASGTVIVTSRSGDPFNFWINDVNTVSDDDPIDLFLGDTDASEINWIIPFEKSCFVGTNGRAQFIISGAENFISPSTVSIDSGNEYSVSSTATPLKVGMYLFFVDRGRLYIHAGGGSANRPNLSFSVSEQAYGYFPYSVKQAISSPASDYLLFLSDDLGEDSHVYIFQQRTLPDGSIGQQAFYRWIFDAPIEYISANGDELKVITKRNNKQYLEILDMSRVEMGDILLDRRYTLGASDIVYSAADNKTTFTLPYNVEGKTFKIVDTETYEEVVGLVEATDANDTFTRVTVIGDYTAKANKLVVGIPYEMKIELSKFIYRDGDSTAADANITLKSLGVRHFNSGTYDIGVIRQGRFETLTTFDPYRTNNPFVTREGRYFDPNGQSSARLTANSDRAQIQIKSSGFIPVNITNLEAFVAITRGRHSAIE